MRTSKLSSAPGNTFGMLGFTLWACLGSAAHAEGNPTPVSPPRDEGEKPTGKQGQDEPKKGTKDEPPAGGTDSKQAAAPAASIDEEYVRENLAGYLSPTTSEWLPDGRVKLAFNFVGKQDEHSDIWTPKVSRDINSKFRWALPREYYGLRMGMDGQALLNCWFADDVEVEATYRQGVNHNAKQLFAVVFVNDALKGIGCNFGTQCATFTRGRVEKATGTVESVAFRQTVDLKLVVRGGTFEVFRGERSNGKAEYSRKTFAGGRVGFIWGGGIAGGVSSLEVTGRIDAKKMAPFLRKAAKE